MSLSINKVLPKSKKNIAAEHNQLEETILNKRENELDWIVGFSEPESMFYISKNVHFFYKN